MKTVTEISTEELLQMLRQSRIDRFNICRRENPDMEIDFSYEVFSGVDLKGVDLRGANLRHTTFIEADLSGANLEGANLAGSNLKMAKLVGTNLRKTNLWGVNIGSAIMDEQTWQVIAGCLRETVMIIR